VERERICLTLFLRTCTSTHPSTKHGLSLVAPSPAGGDVGGGRWEWGTGTGSCSRDVLGAGGAGEAVLGH
jgi:hypothetical protein